MILHVVVGYGEALHHSVVGDGDGRVTPLVGPVHQHSRIGDSVHVAHFRVAVELHPLSGTVVLAGHSKIGNLLHPGQGADGQFMVKPVNGGDALDFQKGALLNIRHLCDLIVAQKHFYGHGIGKIRQVKHKNRFFIADFPAVHSQHLAPDNHLAHLLGDGLDGDGFLLEIPAVDDVGIVRAL